MASKSKSMFGGMHTAGIFADMTVDGPEIGTLVIVVDRAKNLPNRKSMGKQDPYCAARLGKEAKKTETDKRGGQTPRWDQEMRFTVHESPDYMNLKVSVFNDDKKTELIGESWVNLEKVVVPGGGQSDIWHPLNCKGKYAGEIRIELTYYDTRQPPSNPVTARHTPSGGRANDEPEDSPSGPRQQPAVKRRPLPSDPTRTSASPLTVSEVGRSAPGLPSGPRTYGLSPRPGASPERAGRRPHSHDSRHHAEHRQNMPELSHYQTTPEPEGPPAGQGHQEAVVYSGRSVRDQMPMGHPGMGQTEHSIRSSQTHHDMLAQNQTPPNSRRRLPTVPQVGNNHPSYGHDYQQPSRPAEIPHSYSAPEVAHGRVPDYQEDRGEFYQPQFDETYGQPYWQDPYSQEPAGVYQTEPHHMHYSPHDGSPQPPTHTRRSIGVASQEGYSSARPTSSHHLPTSAMQPTVEDDEGDDIPPPPPVHRSSAPAVTQLNEAHLGHQQNMAPAPLNISPRPDLSQDPYSTPSRGYPQRSEHRSSVPSAAQHRYPNSQASPSPLSHQGQYDHRSSGNTMVSTPEHQYSQPDSYNRMRQPPHQRASMASYAPVGRALLTQSTPTHSPQPQSQSESPYQQAPQQPRYAIAYQGEPHRPRARSPRDASPGINHATSTPGYSQPANRSMPTRKSVSPRPSVSGWSEAAPATSTLVPFSPDSFDALVPTTSATSLPSYDDVHSNQASPSPGADDIGPITTFDGRVVDPSDHLPVDSWAPEPERKGPSPREKPARERERVTGARELGSPSTFPPNPRTHRLSNGANMPHTTSMGTPPHTSESPSAYGSVGGSPAGARNRLQKRGALASASPSSGQQPLREHPNYGGYPPSSGGPPPIPAKVPLGGSEDTRALSDEMMRIDIGVGGPRTVGRGPRRGARNGM